MKFLTNSALTNSPITPSILFPEPKTKGGRFIEVLRVSQKSKLFFFFLGYLLFSASVIYSVYRMLSLIRITADVIIGPKKRRSVDRVKSTKKLHSLFPQWKLAKPVSRNRYIKTFSVSQASSPNVFSDHGRQQQAAHCQIINNDHPL